MAFGLTLLQQPHCVCQDASPMECSEYPMVYFVGALLTYVSSPQGSDPLETREHIYV